MAWGSTHKTKLRKLHLKKQKHAIRLIYNENKFTHTRPLMWSLQVPNVFQTDIKKILVFMHRVKTCSDVPSSSGDKFTCPSHRYPTNFLKNNYGLPKYQALRKNSNKRL